MSATTFPETAAVELPLPLDCFHTAFVVDDLDAGMAELTALAGAAWTDPAPRELTIRAGAGRKDVSLRFAYTREGPHHIELIEALPGTVWEAPRAASGAAPTAHHVGVWSADVASASLELERRGAPRLVTYDSEHGGAVGFAYHRLASGLIVELVEADRKHLFEQWFAGAGFPRPQRSSE